jgi:hypothetical protein
MPRQTRPPNGEGAEHATRAPAERAPTRDARELLSIDVTAEIRKLGMQQLATPIDIVAAAVRMTVECGAHNVDVVTGRTQVRVLARGARMPVDVHAQLACILDASRPSDTRHAALVAWENDRRLEWLAVVCASDVELQTQSEEGTEILEVRDANGRHRRTADTGEPHMTVVLRRLRVNDLEQLTRAFTFARLPISIDGERVSFGLELPEALIAVPIAGAGFNGAVGLPREPGIARTTLVRSEVVEREIVTSPSRGRVHIAVVSSRARLPDIAANERTVMAARDQLYDELRTRYALLAPDDHSAAAELLFRACEDRGDTSLLDDARIIRTTRGDFVTLAALRTMARDGVLLAAEPDQSVDADLRDIGLPVLSQRERAFVTRFMGLRCVTPTYRSADAPLRRLRRLVRDSVHNVSRRLLGLGGGRTLADAELTADERTFMRALTDLVDSGRFRVPGVSVGERVQIVATARGRLPAQARKRRDGRVVCVPLRTAKGQKLVRMVVRDPATIVIAVTIVFGGQDGYGRERNRARAALIQKSPS